MINSLTRKKLKILIRTAGGTAHNRQLGLGHIYRCLNLATYLKSNEIHFLVEDYGGVKQILKEKKFKNIQLLKKGINFNSDIKKSISYIQKKKIDIIIIDKYKINPIYVKKLSQYTKTVVISDLKNINYHADLIVNGFIGYRNQISKNKFGVKCLLGPSYQILNKNFSKMKLSHKKKYNLLVTFGGFDEKNITGLLLKPLTRFLRKIKVKIILGPSTKKSNKIRNWQRIYQKNVRIIDKTKDMYREIACANFGICSGGITSYEFAALHVPFVIICQVGHQLTTAKEWQRRKIAINLGLVNKRTEKRVERLLERLVRGEEVYRFSKKPIVDGKGLKRVSLEILRMIEK